MRDFLWTQFGIYLNWVFDNKCTVKLEGKKILNLLLVITYMLFENALPSDHLYHHGLSQQEVNNLKLILATHPVQTSRRQQFLSKTYTIIKGTPTGSHCVWKHVREQHFGFRHSVWRLSDFFLFWWYQSQN